MRRSRARLAVCVLSVAGAALWSLRDASAGSARDYLNAPIDSWFAIYNAGYAASVTPEDGLDVTAQIRTNVALQASSLLIMGSNETPLLGKPVLPTSSCFLVRLTGGRFFVPA